jgi:hypothetical protein
MVPAQALTAFRRAPTPVRVGTITSILPTRGILAGYRNEGGVPGGGRSWGVVGSNH